MTQHTPGPWQYAFGGGTTAFITEADGSTIICIRTTENTTAHKNLAANARLIASAPELLEALVELSKSFIGTYTNDQRSDDEIDDHRLLWENKARELIARITGDTK